MAVMKAMIASGSTELDASNEAFVIGTEIEAGEAISLDIIEQFYSLREDGGFAVKNVSESEEPLYGSWANAMVCGSWEECYKKYGADALEVWESRIR